MTGFFYYLAALGSVLSGSTLLPVLVAFGIGENDVGYRMLLYACLGIFMSCAVLLSIAGREVGLERRAAALLVVASWIFFPVMVAIPLADLGNLSYTSALFQAMSGFTTTGSVVFPNIEAVPRSVIFFLAQLQWLGAVATLITFILILSPWEIGGLPKIASVSETASIVASQYRLVRFCLRILRAMVTLTAICFVSLVLLGVPVFEAMVLSYSALSTGGITPSDANLDLMLGNGGMIVMAIFFLIAATSIFWHRSIVNFRIAELGSHRESYFVLVVWLAVAILLSYRILDVSGSADTNRFAASISEGMMNAASLISTSGIQSRPGIFALIAPTFVILLMMIGSGCFSTAGGIKFFRLGVVFRHSNYELNRLIYPSSIQSTRFSSGHLSIDYMKGVWGFFSIWILALGFIALFMTLSGLNFQAGLTAAAAALSNAGPVYGTFWSTAETVGWVPYSEMSGFQLWLLTVGMLLGRLEIVVVFASFALFLKSRS